jgi:hypothetical protein
LALLVQACSSAAEREHGRTMDQIEQQVRLPADALGLDKYARYYAVDGKRVVGTYITNVDPQNRYYDLPIGKRRWLDDHRSLPGISDGGCSVVNVVYDPAIKKVEQAFCNGLA